MASRATLRRDATRPSLAQRSATHVDVDRRQLLDVGERLALPAHVRPLLPQHPRLAPARGHLREAKLVLFARRDGRGAARPGAPEVGRDLERDALVLLLPGDRHRPVVRGGDARLRRDSDAAGAVVDADRLIERVAPGGAAVVRGVEVDPDRVRARATTPGEVEVLADGDHL